MIELNFDNPLAKQIRPCRRIVLKDGVNKDSIDPNWSRKMWTRRKGEGVDYIILRNPKTEVPKGFKIEEEYKDGEVLPGQPEERIIFKGEKMFLGPTVSVHSCRKVGSDTNGMFYRYEPLEGAEMREF